MEDKTYGVKTHLVEEFKQLQIDRQKTKIPVFIGQCTLLINSEPMRIRVEAFNGFISMTPFPLHPLGLNGFQIPPQHLDLTIPKMLTISLHQSLKILLIFDTEGQWRDFICLLNLPPENNSSCKNSVSSRSGSNPSSDSGFRN